MDRRQNQASQEYRRALDRSVIVDEATNMVRLDVVNAGKILDAEEAHLKGLIDELWS